MDSIALLRDPLWQFVGAVLGLVAILLTVWLYRRQLQRKALECTIVSNTSLASVNPQFKGKIEIRVDGRDMPNARLVVLRIRNSGNVPIEDTHFKEPVTLSFGDAAEVISAEVVEAEPRSLSASLEGQGNARVLKTALLNSGDSLLLNVLVNNLEEVKVDGRIVGVKEIEVRELPAGGSPGGVQTLRWMLAVILIFEMIAASVSIFMLRALDSR